MDYSLKISRLNHFNVTEFSDADWSADPDDRRSTSGRCIFLGSNLVSWSSKKQHTLSYSSNEAEYQSHAGVVSKITWLQSLV